MGKTLSALSDWEHLEYIFFVLLNLLSLNLCMPDSTITKEI